MKGIRRKKKSSSSPDYSSPTSISEEATSIASTADSSFDNSSLVGIRIPAVVSNDSDDTSDYFSPLDGTKDKDTVLAMVVYEQPSTKSLPDSLHTWTRAADSLMKSQEFRLLMNSSKDVVTSVVFSGRDVACNTGSLVVKTACLPVTLPLHVAHQTTNLVFGVAGNVLDLALGNVHSIGENSQSPVQGLVHNIVNFLPFVACQVGGAVGHVLGLDQLQHNEETTGESSTESENILDRLRLDIYVEQKESERAHCPCPGVSSRAAPSDISKYLLRVDDVSVCLPPNPEDSPKSKTVRVMYIDLGNGFSEEDLTRDALDKLKARALVMTATNEIFKYKTPNASACSTMIEWKPEGNTARNTRKMGQRSDQECYRTLEENVLIWSGKYREPSIHCSDTPLFMARGVVKKSPREFLNMMWNSNRTSEYNVYSLGRSDSLVIDDNITNGGSCGAKVVKSETRVPFTGLALTLTALMHVSALDDEDGFIIVSRSLNSGVAGYHTTKERVEANYNSEILMGINILRPVPGKPNMTDLTTLSQVYSSVPNFLAIKIGIMGVEDFFNNVR
jgi:hypothetical protein